jgi:hypothetical protein
VIAGSDIAARVAARNRVANNGGRPIAATNKVPKDASIIAIVNANTGGARPRFA